MPAITAGWRNLNLSSFFPSLSKAISVHTGSGDRTLIPASLRSAATTASSSLKSTPNGKPISPPARKRGKLVVDAKSNLARLISSTDKRAGSTITSFGLGEPPLRGGRGSSSRRRGE